jgi:hypothetical protein
MPDDGPEDTKKYHDLALRPGDKGFDSRPDNKPPKTIAKPEQGSPPGDQSSDHAATMGDINNRAYELTLQASQQHEEAIRVNQQYIKQLEDFQKNNERLQPPELQKYPEPPPQFSKEQQKKNVGAVLAYTAITMALGFASGSKGSYGVWKGFGQGLKNLQAGQKEEAKEAFTTWKDQVYAIDKQNKQKLDLYKEVMSDRTATIKEKLDVLKMLAGAHKDQAGQDMAEAGDWEKFTKYVAGQEKLHNNVHKTFGQHDADFNKLLQNPEYSGWIDDNLTKYPQLHADYYSGDSNKRGKALAFMNEHNPWSKFYKEHYKEYHPSKKDEASGVEPGATPGASEKPEDLDSFARDFFNEAHGSGE